LPTTIVTDTYPISYSSGIELTNPNTVSYSDYYSFAFGLIE
jgi:hypothetical protein